VGNTNALSDIEQCLSFFEFLDSFGVAQKLKEQFERICLS
ncbi:XRE family transcriptional regulator, partial [Streptococcus oralis]|nr:XRE family transcriptional regulator [Streptococcus oralis]